MLTFAAPATGSPARPNPQHDWLVKEGVALDISLDSVVLKRMRQFAQVSRRGGGRSQLVRRSGCVICRWPLV